MFCVKRPHKSLDNPFNNKSVVENIYVLLIYNSLENDQNKYISQNKYQVFESEYTVLYTHNFNLCVQRLLTKRII